ncbi:hypothetical protein OA50_03681 [Mameliella alba]|uniref:Uncharacterized protein n=1 Tax=Mameliella alba TaxID=561184 RepID=A0A0B3SML2_9RHOB|nr:hypothetical protein OA50_03681 [Mameliella alba]
MFRAGAKGALAPFGLFDWRERLDCGLSSFSAAPKM